MGLIEPADMPLVPGASVPKDVYLVTRDPAPLAGMAYPSWEGFTWDALARLGVVGVVCLTGDRFPYSPQSLIPLASVGLKDLIGGRVPEDEAAEERRIHRAAETVLSELRQARGIVVHCAGGTGRTGTVLGCVLRGLGYEAATVVRYLDRVNKARGKDGWPESGWQAAVVEAYLP